MLTRSHAVSYTSVNDNLDNALNANEWIIEGNKPLALDDLAVLLSTLKLWEMLKYDIFCQLILASKASYPSSDFYEGDDGHLHRRNPWIPGLQDYNWLSYNIVFEVDSVPWLTITSVQDTLASHEPIKHYSKPTIGCRWRLMSPLPSEIAYMVEKVGFGFASQQAPWGCFRHLDPWNCDYQYLRATT